MDVTRCGAQRDRGTTVLMYGVPLEVAGRWDDMVKWNRWSKVLEVTPKNIPHKDGITRHNYEIRLTLEDISSLITILGHAASATDATLLRDHLANHVPAIVKLLACATGIAPGPLAKPAQTVSS